MTPLRLLAIAVVLAAAGSPARADDDEPEYQHMQFVERGDVLTVTTDITKLFDASAYQALSSGFVTNVELHFWVYARDSNDVVAETVVHRSAVYDMWDEDYTIRLCEACKAIVVKSPAETLKLITNIDDLAVANLAAIPYEDVYFLGLRADLNPVDKRTLTEVRRWLSQSPGGGLDRGSTFFGSFVSVFVNPKIAEADRVLRIRSQPFYRPKPKS